MSFSATSPDPTSLPQRFARFVALLVHAVDLRWYALGPLHGVVVNRLDRLTRILGTAMARMQAGKPAPVRPSRAPTPAPEDGASPSLCDAALPRPLPKSPRAPV